MYILKFSFPRIPKDLTVSLYEDSDQCCICIDIVSESWREFFLSQRNKLFERRVIFWPGTTRVSIIQDLLKTNKCRLGFRKIQKSVLSNLMSKMQKLEKFRSQSFVQSLTPPFKLNIRLVFNNWFERFLFMGVCNILYFSFSWLFFFLFGSEPTKHLSWWRRLSSLFSEDVLIKTNIFPIAIRLAKVSSRRLVMMSSRRFQEVSSS